MIKRTTIFILFSCFFAHTQIARADCLAASCNQIEGEVISCKEVDPSKKSFFYNSKYYGNAAYQGVILELNITKREQIECHPKYKVDYDWMNKISLPHQMQVFRQIKEDNPCDKYGKESAIKGKLSLSCCDGGGPDDPPCLLGLEAMLD